MDEEIGPCPSTAGHMEHEKQVHEVGNGMLSYFPSEYLLVTCRHIVCVRCNINYHLIV